MGKFDKYQVPVDSEEAPAAPVSKFAKYQVPVDTGTIEAAPSNPPAPVDENADATNATGYVHGLGKIIPGLAGVAGGIAGAITPGDTWAAGKARMERRGEDVEKKFPVAVGTGEVASNIALGLATGGAGLAKQGTSSVARHMLANAASRAVVQGTIGAVQGGAADGISGAVKGGLAGGTAGALLPVLGDAKSAKDAGRFVKGLTTAAQWTPAAANVAFNAPSLVSGTPAEKVRAAEMLALPAAARIASHGSRRADTYTGHEKVADEDLMARIVPKLQKESAARQSATEGAAGPTEAALRASAEGRYEQLHGTGGGRARDLRDMKPLIDKPDPANDKRASYFANTLNENTPEEMRFADEMMALIDKHGGVKGPAREEWLQGEMNRRRAAAAEKAAASGAAKAPMSTPVDPVQAQIEVDAAKAAARDNIARTFEEEGHAGRTIPQQRAADTRARAIKSLARGAGGGLLGGIAGSAMGAGGSLIGAATGAGAALLTSHPSKSEGLGRFLTRSVGDEVRGAPAAYRQPAKASVTYHDLAKNDRGLVSDGLSKEITQGAATRALTASMAEILAEKKRKKDKEKGGAHK